MTDSPHALVLLDVNGLLASKTQDTEEIDDLCNCGYETMERRKYSFICRPGADEFVQELLKHYRVGIFSSTTLFNLRPLLEGILEEETRKSLHCFLGREHVTWDKNWTPESTTVEKWDTTKDLSRVIDSPFGNPQRDVTLRNILLVEQEERKCETNPRENYLLLDDWTPCGDVDAESFEDTLCAIHDAVRELQAP